MVNPAMGIVHSSFYQSAATNIEYEQTDFDIQGEDDYLTNKTKINSRMAAVSNTCVYFLCVLEQRRSLYKLYCCISHYTFGSD